MPRSVPGRPRWSLLLTGVAAVLTACTTGTSPSPSPAPTGATGEPQPVAAALAAGLTAGDLTRVPFSGATPRQADAALDQLVAGMGPRRPEVALVGVERSGETASARLGFTWRFPGVRQAWTYQTTAPLVLEAGGWRARWQPSIVEGRLTSATRLSQRRLYPRRGELLGEEGSRIVTLRPVVRIGLDKAGLSGPQQQRSASRLARLVGIDPEEYAELVTDSGPQAFVEAIVFRATAKDRPRNREVFVIEGALAIDDEQMLAPTREFARPILGTVGEATEEIVAESRGAVVTGDQVGLSGLQRRYDATMRGVPGVLVQRVAAPPAGASSPSPSPSAATEAHNVALFRVDPGRGRDLVTTLNVYSQRLAERTLAKTRPAAALVAIRPSSGAVIAAANNAGTDDQSLATIGQFAPGSTFKVATALALLRRGLDPDSQVECPRTIDVDGREFGNYSDYPDSALGSVDLRTAIAQSCNTALIAERDRLADGDLARAAASLGVGTDYDVGFPAFFGSVPPADSETGRAAAVIGQGQVAASPLAMAAVPASVVAGHTVVPHLVEGRTAEPQAPPLTGAEARQLRELMGAVVTEGSGRFLGSLDGPPVLAKTGTAEYGTERPLRTHAWMIGAQGDLAVAVFVADGDSGSRTAGPLLRRFLRGSR